MDDGWKGKIIERGSTGLAWGVVCWVPLGAGGTYLTTVRGARTGNAQAFGQTRYSTEEQSARTQ